MTGTPKFEATIQPWGNSLGLRITKSMSELAQLPKGAKVTVEVTTQGIVVRKKTGRKKVRFPYTETALLKGMTPYKAHADELPSLLTSELER